MRKEVILAIILGLILGSVLVYGIYTANKSVQNTQNPPLDTTNPTPTPTPTDLSLTIYSPEDGSLFNSETATISGTTKPENVVFILTEDDEILVETKEDGSFSEEISLIKGGNLIQVTSISPTGEKHDQYINLVYTTK